MAIGGAIDFLFDHQLISIPTYAGLKQYCSQAGRDPPPHRKVDPLKCAVYEQIAHEEMGPINLYNIYADVCPPNQRYSYSNGEALLKYLARSESEISLYARNALKQMKIIAPYYPCQNDFLQKYLNDPAVQKAIHAERTEWVNCSHTLNYDGNDGFQSMLPIYTNILFPEKLDILIYSGDVDAVVSAEVTRRWIPMLIMKVITPWHPWMDSRGQVGGYTEVYDHLTFTTVRNAGHQVPSFQPRRAYDMFSRFLKGKK